MTSMKRLLIILIVLLLSVPAFAQTYTVERVIDCATLKLTNGEEVKLIGIDCLASFNEVKAKKDAKRTGQDVERINKMGRRAKIATVVRVMRSKKYDKGLKVRIDFDVQKRDKYGRLLGYVFVQDLVANRHTYAPNSNDRILIEYDDKLKILPREYRAPNYSGMV